MRVATAAILAAGFAAAPFEAVRAEDAALASPSTAPASPPTVANAEQPSISSSVPALGDFKKALLDRGVNLQLNYIQDTFGNPTGGVKQTLDYESVLYMVVDSNLGMLMGLDGMSFRVNAYQIQGRGISAHNIYNLAPISSLEALPTTRLFELWLEQKFFGDLVSIRVGQQVADNQFFNTDAGALFVNNSFGWPTITSSDLPSGGPGYPLSTPGIRVKVTPNEQLALLAAIFNGDPSGAGFTGQQEVKDPAGINFRIQDPPFVIAEAQYRYNQDKNAPGLAGTVRVGGWYHFGPFSDYHIGYDGQSLAAPTSSGWPMVHNGNFGIYGVIDQMLWRLPGSDDPKKGIGAFSRISFSPPDRNLIDFYAEGGVEFMGLIAQRPDDSFGCAAVFTHLSAPVRALDRDTAFFSGESRPLRNYELDLEVTYQAQIVPGWIVQPDFQYIFHPGGGAVDPINSAVGRIPDAAVFGIRTMVSF
ncbi:carbohydrate porin [Methylocapsa acidiphila]|uniref:carbohydrate porin n=1 Tax=Methylocapsa acidiphila TaxID=133552 RepID=UPI0004205AD7|nr:carbohydrate porin [Methylocapsa acidiphila]